MRVLAISGSLRAASLNTALLEAAKLVAPAGMDIELLSITAKLPLFNPDLEQSLPSLVAELHHEISAAEALLIASPEYAHGVTGAMKNLLDWLVGCEAFAGKPVAVLNASSRARHADAALREILRTMAAVLAEEASIQMPLEPVHQTAELILADPVLRLALSGALLALQHTVATNDSQSVLGRSGADRFDQSEA